MKILNYDDRMPQWVHVGLVNTIQQEMKPDDCTGDDRRTVAFLEAHGVDVDEALAWLDEHGVSCDCGVVMNTHPRIAEDDGPVH